MGQLINRISRLIKTEISGKSQSSESYSGSSEDDELKRIIEELNRESDKSRHHGRAESSAGSARAGAKENTGAKGRTDKEPAGRVMDDTLAFSILGISPGATHDQIKSAYKQKVKEYHPDKVASLGQEIRDLAANKTLEINKAYEHLRASRGF